MTQLETITSKLCGARSELIELLDIAFEEFDVGTLIAEPIAMPVDMGAGGRQLLVGHIDTDDFAILADDLRHEIDVAPRA